MTRLTILLISLFIAANLLTGCSSGEKATMWEINNSCDLHLGSCYTINDKQDKQQKVTLSIEPNDPIIVAKMFNVTVNIEGIEAKRVQLDIAGTSMFMGFNRINLYPTDIAGTYQGKSMLAFCTVSKMEWLISVVITKDDDTLIQIPFELITFQSRN